MLAKYITMRIPSTINVNTLKCYELKEGFACSENNVINCEKYGIWNDKSPNTLKQLCIISIAQNWAEYPKLEELVLPEDRCMLLSVLPEDLPLELTVPRIPDNMYWKKCYLKKWPSRLFRNVIDIDMFLQPSALVARYEHSTLEHVEISSTNSDKYSAKNEYSQLKTWKQLYLENYMKEMLENLDPVKYDPEEIKILCDICGPYVKILHLEQLKCYDGNELGHGGTRIALNAVLAGLSKLQEVSICLKQKYVGINNFSWNVIQLSVQDINFLSKGLEKNRLHILRLINSDFEGTKCMPILKAMLKYDCLRTLDLSYSNIGDHGAALICKFSMEVEITELLLIDNNIGPIGGETFAYILNKPCCTLKVLNLRMNPIGSRIGNLILSSLIENKSVKYLNLEACNIKVDKNIGQLLQTSTLEELYISNNHIGDEIGNVILNSLYSNRNLKKFDLRMCCIHSDTQQKISEKVKENKLKQFHISHTCKNQIKLHFDHSFVLYFNSIQLYENPVPKDETIPLNIE